MFIAEGLGFEVEGFRLVDGVDAAVRPGAVTAIVGANGAGKSTLLRLMAGELVPSTGRVVLEDRPLSMWPLCDSARRRGCFLSDPR